MLSQRTPHTIVCIFVFAVASVRAACGNTAINAVTQTGSRTWREEQIFKFDEEEGKDQDLRNTHKSPRGVAAWVGWVADSPGLRGCGSLCTRPQDLEYMKHPASFCIQSRGGQSRTTQAIIPWKNIHSTGNLQSHIHQCSQLGFFQQ